MSVWLAIPSKRPPEVVEPLLELWRGRGYKIALARDETDAPIADDLPTWHGGEPYPGYAVAVNRLISHILAFDSKAEWIVTGGDDVEPDPNHSAEEIASQCFEYFDAHPTPMNEGYFGVMQPTGDRWGEHDVAGGHKFELWPDQPERCIHCGQEADAPRHMIGAYIDRVAGSPWIGRQFAARMYRGTGPYWHEYTHMGVDEELQEVAIKMGVFWQRPDLTHYHNHWGRPRGGAKYGDAVSMPDFLQHANTGAEWDRYKRILKTRRALGFPGHEPVV